MSVSPGDRIALGSCTCDPRTGHVALSASLRTMVGRSQTDDLALDAFLALVHPDDRDPVGAALRPAAGAAPRARLCRFVRPDGDVRWTVLRATPTPGEAGAPDHIVGLVFDATPGYVAFRAVVDAAADAFDHEFAAAPVALLLAAGTRANESIDANDAACGLFAMTRDAFSQSARSGWLTEALALESVVASIARGERFEPRVVRLRRPEHRAQPVLVLAERATGTCRVVVALIDASVRFDAGHGASALDDQLHDLVEQAPEAMACTEHDVILECNVRFAEALGESIDRLRGARLSAVVDPIAPADEAPDGIRPFVARVRHRDGRVVPFEISARLLRRGDRTIRVLTLRDVSERERADRAIEALRQSREQFRHLAEAHGEGIVLIDEHDRVVHANSKFATMLGYELNDVAGQPWATFSALDTSETAEREADDAMVSTAWRRDGVVFPIEVECRAVETGGHRYRLITVRDVSRRERAEQLRRALVAGTAGVTGDAFFRAVVQHLAAALDVSSTFVAEFTGLPPDRMRALSFWRDGALAPPFDVALAGTPGDLVMQAGAQYVTRDVATLFPADPLVADLGAVAYFAAPLFDGGGHPVGVLAAIDRRPVARTDAADDLLTVFAARASVELQRLRGETAIRVLNADLERRVAERTAALQSANRELEAFSYSVSHDLRAPLRHIDGFVDLLLADRESTLGPSAIEHVGEIDAAVDRMTVLINTLLDFSRLGRVAVRATAVDVVALIRTIADEASKDVGGRVVRWSIEPIDPVWGDPVLLRQVFANLLGNALKYTRTREVATIAVGPAPGAQAGEVVCAVSDNGVGFDMRYADKLFGVFQRLHPPSRFEGTGIGLANVHRIVTRHGGRVWAEAAVDRGATFYVALPAAAARMAEPA